MFKCFVYKKHIALYFSLGIIFFCSLNVSFKVQDHRLKFSRNSSVHWIVSYDFFFKLLCIPDWCSHTKYRRHTIFCIIKFKKNAIKIELPPHKRKINGQIKKKWFFQWFICAIDFLTNFTTNPCKITSRKIADQIIEIKKNYRIGISFFLSWIETCVRVCYDTQW